MRFTTIFFDLDDTLYPSSAGLWKNIKERIGIYMYERMHIPQEEVPTLREKYLLEYGTTMRGLQAHHKIDTEDFLAYVHDLRSECDLLRFSLTLMIRYIHPVQACGKISKNELEYTCMNVCIFHKRKCQLYARNIFWNMVRPCVAYKHTIKLIQKTFSPMYMT